MRECYDWKQYFRDNPDREEMFQAFKMRIDEDPDDQFDLDECIEKHVERERDVEEENNLFKYEKNEYYREQWAIKKGYEFKPKEYDPDEKYK